jgi:hypothetical protein
VLALEAIEPRRESRLLVAKRREILHVFNLVVAVDACDQAAQTWWRNHGELRGRDAPAAVVVARELEAGASVAQAVVNVEPERHGR